MSDEKNNKSNASRKHVANNKTTIRDSDNLFSSVNESNQIRQFDSRPRTAKPLEKTAKPKDK